VTVATYLRLALRLKCRELTLYICCSVRIPGIALRRVHEQLLFSFLRVINDNVLGRVDCASFQIIIADFCPQRVRNSQTTNPSKLFQFDSPLPQFNPLWNENVNFRMYSTFVRRKRGKRDWPWFFIYLIALFQLHKLCSLKLKVF
jgi:hypothetical protein